MKPNPYISICIPTYRRPALLAEAIGCAIRSGDACGRSYEIVVGNFEPEQKIVCEHPNVRVFNFHHHPIHIGWTRNILWSYARGRVLNFKDDDDLWSSDWLKIALRKMRFFGDQNMYGLYGTEYFLIDTDPARVVYGDAHWNYVFTDTLLKRLNGYGTLKFGIGSDIMLVYRIKRLMESEGLSFPPGRPHTLYRKFTINAFHESNRTGTLEDFNLRRQRGTKNFKRGTVVVDPIYNNDIDLLVKIANISTAVHVSEVDPCWASNKKGVMK